MDVTTRDLFMRLGSTSQRRSARADAVFRRLRVEKQDLIADALMRAPRRLDAADLSDLGDGRHAACKDRKRTQGKTPGTMP